VQTSLVDYNLASYICKNGAPYSRIYRPSLIRVRWSTCLFLLLRLCILRVDFDYLSRHAPRIKGSEEESSYY
jgi:hypothetical protein